MDKLYPPADHSLEAKLAGVAMGDRMVFAQLYDLTSSRLYGIIRRILPNAEQAEDALQETYVKIWQRAGSFQPSLGPALAWMGTIARNQAIDLRRRSAERLSQLSEELDADRVADTADPEILTNQIQNARQLSKCLGGLPQDRRDMILLAYHQGWSREELARRFGRPVTTVKTILRRSLIALRACLDAA